MHAAKKLVFLIGFLGACFFAIAIRELYNISEYGASWVDIIIPVTLFLLVVGCVGIEAYNDSFTKKRSNYNTLKSVPLESMLEKFLQGKSDINESIFFDRLLSRTNSLFLIITWIYFIAMSSVFLYIDLQVLDTRRNIIKIVVVFLTYAFTTKIFGEIVYRIRERVLMRPIVDMVVFYWQKPYRTIAMVLIFLFVVAIGISFTNLWGSYALFVLLSYAVYFLMNLAKAHDNAIEKARNVERFKTNLITNVSHDLKTPLTAIILQLEWLKSQSLHKKIADSIAKMDSQSARLKQLLKDLLDTSESNSNSSDICLVNISLAEIVEQIAVEFYDSFEEKNLILVNSKSKETSIVHTKPRQLQRILVNLFSNVSKYSHPGTRVFAEVLSLEGVHIFSLKNISKDVINIPVDELRQPFVRGDKSRTSEGHGLGLSIAESFIEDIGRLVINMDGDLFEAYLVFSAHLDFKEDNMLEILNMLPNSIAEIHKLSESSQHRHHHCTLQIPPKSLNHRIAERFRRFMMQVMSKGDESNYTSRAIVEQSIINQEAYKYCNPTNCTTIDLIEVTEQVMSDFNHRFSERGLTICLKKQVERIHIWAPIDDLRRVLDILFTNIIVHALPNTRVFVSVAAHHDELVSGLVSLSIKNISHFPLSTSEDELFCHIFRVSHVKKIELSNVDTGLPHAYHLVKRMYGDLDVFTNADLFTVEAVFYEIKL